MKNTLFVAALLAAPLAQAHVHLEQKTATAGAFQKLTVRVPHGCAGSATNGVTVLIPEGVISAKPMPKAGWNIATVDAKLAAPVLLHGVTLTSVVREVSWKGGPLPDAQYDEFNLQVKMPDAAGKYYFKVLQLCDKGRSDWVDVPATPGAAMKFAAPMVDVVPAPAAQH